MTRDGRKLVWVLQGHREGDNAQARNLAALTGQETVLKQLRFGALHMLPNLIIGARLLSLDRAASAKLVPPWPDLVIAAGKRTVPVARWIRKQSRGTTRLVQIGRPRAPLSWFDLVVTSPQYGLPELPNVIELPLPLVGDASPSNEELLYWAGLFAALPKPHTGVLVGGGRFPLRLDRLAAERLLASLAGESGSLLISTSPRTPPEVLAAFTQFRARPACVHRWSRQGPNPHRSILALADRFVVTSDSVSMLAEAKATGKAVAVWPLPRSPWHFTWQAKQGLGALLAKHGILTPPRDIDRIDPDAASQMGALRSRIQGLLTQSRSA